LLGVRSSKDDNTDIGYFVVRAALAKVVPRAAVPFLGRSTLVAIARDLNLRKATGYDGEHVGGLQPLPSSWHASAEFGEIAPVDAWFE
jgi:hypothetical protein